MVAAGEVRGRWQQLENIIEPGGYLFGGQDVYPSADELDCQWNAVEILADPGDCPGILGLSSKAGRMAWARSTNKRTASNGLCLPLHRLWTARQQLYRSFEPILRVRLFSHSRSELKRG